jgi:general secretion pathway protein C
MLDLFFRKYAWTANLALLFLAAWLTARIVNTVVGALVRPRPQADLTAQATAPARPAAPASIDDARLYHLIGADPPPQAEATAAQATPRRPQNCGDPAAQPVKSELRLALVAGVLTEPRRASLATLADLSSRETRVLAVGDRIGNAELLGLERLGADGDMTHNAFRLVAVVCNEGTKEFVEADASGGTELASGGLPNLGTAPVPRPPGPAGNTMEGVRAEGNNRYAIERKVIDTTLGDLNQIATQARIVPSFKNGVANGFKLFAIQPGSLYSAIGVENGDVIERVNGYEINSPEKALELYQKLRDSTHVTIELERNGQPVRKEYNITGP